MIILVFAWLRHVGNASHGVSVYFIRIPSSQNISCAYHVAASENPPKSCNECDLGHLMIVVVSMTGGCCGEVNGGGERLTRGRTFFSLPLPKQSPSPGSKERRRKLKTTTFLRERVVWRREREWGFPEKGDWRRLKTSQLSLPSLPEGRLQLSQCFSLFNFQFFHVHFFTQPLLFGGNQEEPSIFSW